MRCGHGGGDSANSIRALDSASRASFQTTSINHCLNCQFALIFPKERMRVTCLVWLGREDSNLRMRAPKARVLPLDDAPVEKASGIDRNSQSNVTPLFIGRLAIIVHSDGNAPPKCSSWPGSVIPNTVGPLPDIKIPVRAFCSR